MRGSSLLVCRLLAEGQVVLDRWLEGILTSARGWPCRKLRVDDDLRAAFISLAGEPMFGARGAKQKILVSLVLRRVYD